MVPHPLYVDGLYAEAFYEGLWLRLTDRVPDLPLSLIQPAVQGLSSNLASSEMSQGEFRFDFEQDLPPIGSSAARSSGDLYFRVDRRLHYEIDGALTVVDPAPRMVVFELALSGEGEQVYASHQESHATPNSAFVLGELAGDFRNALTG